MLTNPFRKFKFIPAFYFSEPQGIDTQHGILFLALSSMLMFSHSSHGCYNNYSGLVLGRWMAQIP